ncbi:FAD-dependent oxidoreductase [Dyadobacter frigoris]|uniref:FAD-dependent oxidoreductase n=1 Tax=Dyadobacter frigoris TaxID=2576211 RepID=A0A4U6D6C9_9BACT|nr:FAD-dependent oxidoreductase [Dyadobacter frigoris]TKT91811.1 FAD-dependent oxidoreductase [Dyadobacter frigoris]GLU53330.1 xanthan lyase [Dyadobacter frigoris]
MKIKLAHIACIVAFVLSGFQSKTETPEQADICIYGATSAGVIAAYTAKKMGKSVILIEPGNHLGGMTSGGLGYTDIGNKYAITGLSRDFYRRIGAHYGKFEQWIFEPHVAKKYLQQYLDEAGIKVLYQHRITKVNKSGKVIQSIILEKSDNPEAKTNKVISAKMYIDCTYEGDLMAKSGVSYKAGREANSDYKETINGVQLQDGHQLPDGVDPYKIPGKPESGLLWGIATGSLDPNGSGDRKVQAYNYRICLTSDPKNSIPISKPENYDPSQFDLLVRMMQKQPAKTKLGDYFIWSKMPNNKTDINNRGGFSTDMIGMDYEYPDADYKTRRKIIDSHESYTKSLLYFFGHDERVLPAIREEMLKWGYPKDEYTDSGNWSPQLYIREARRMIGNYVMTQANCEGKEVVKDGVGMAAYQMDSHNCQRIVVNGMVKNEGNVEHSGFGPYPISYNSLVPKESECSNLLVPVCLSATHIAYGSIRMEPVFMVLAQSSAAAAVMAIEGKTSVQKIDIVKLQHQLKTNPLANNSAPEILVDNEDASHIKTEGDWTVQKKGGYGPSFIKADDNGKSSRSVTFTPTITKNGEYNIYAYFPKIPKLATEMDLTVSDGKTDKEIVVKESDIVVEGQTSGEWFHVGKFNLPKGTASNVKISAKAATGTLVADAVLFVPDFK